MSDLEVVIMTRDIIVSVLNDLKERGILDKAPIRYAMIEYNLMKAIGQLDTMIEDMNNEDT